MTEHRWRIKRKKNPTCFTLWETGFRTNICKKHIPTSSAVLVTNANHVSMLISKAVKHCQLNLALVSMLVLI